MMNRAGGFCGAALIAVVASLAAIANLSGATFFGPSPYLSITNSPFYGQHFGYFHVENFEDGALNTPGVAVNGGIVAAPGTGTDSVDADDGVMDGFGRNGYSYYSKFTLTNFTFNFSSNALGKLPTHAGVVYTDSVGGFLASFEAFDRQGNSLGIIGPFSVGVMNQNTGETAEDRFFGVIHSDGISAIKINCNDTDWEIDHLQYGAMEDSAPVITNQPISRTVNQGEDAEFSVTAYGRYPLSYQWQFNGSDITAATNSTLALNAVSPAQAGDYRVVISNDLGVVTSTVARLTVVPPCTPVPSDLVSWWTADGHPFDLSGLNDATLLNGATYTNGFVGQAFYFDGQDDQVQAATAGLPTGTSDRTLEAWFKPDQDIGGFAWIAGYIDSLTSPGYNKSYSVGWYQGRVYWTAWGNIITGGPTISTGEWHHVAVASSNGFSRLYLDGVEIANNDSPTSGGNMAFNTPANSIFLMGNGLNLPDVSRKFNGAIDEVSIYGRALSSAEISAIYEAGVAGKCRPQVPPSLTGQSLTLTTVLGEALTLTANASGTAPLVYQWYFNATNPMEGATARSLTIPAARLEDSGEYSVIVSNAYGIVTGVVARLTVLVPSCTPVPPGLVGWWRAENSATNEVDGQAASLVGGTSYTDGQVGRAWSFDGMNDEVIAPASSNLNVTSVTVEGWINTTTLTKAQPVIEYFQLGVINGLMLWINMPANGYADYPMPGTLYANLPTSQGANHSLCSATNIISPNAWQHVAMTYDYATGLAYLYVNGAIVANTNLGSIIPRSEAALHIGGRPTTPFWFSGKIDELSVYNRALTSNEIAAIYAAEEYGKCGPHVPPSVMSSSTNMVVPVGGSLALSPTVSGTTPLSYQWRFNGSDIPGGNAPVFQIPALTMENSGEYALVVSNAYGMATGLVANVTVFVPTCSPAPAGLVGWWRAENNAMNEVDGQAASVIGGTSYADGRVGRAFSFDGIDDEIVVPASTNLNVRSVTVESWINTATLAKAQPIMEYFQLGVINGLCLWINMPTSGNANVPVPGSLYADLPTAQWYNNIICSKTNVITSNAWQHVALTYDYASGVARLFANGAVVATANLGQIIPRTEAALHIGAIPTTPFFFNGQIDEFSIYNRALSTNEIAAIYAAGAHGKCGPQVPPSLSAEPLSLVAGLGDSFTLTANASGTAPLVYQWYFNDTNVIEGATARTLTIPVARLEDSGEYSVIVSNAFGVVTGVVANVAVQPLPPTIVIQPASQSVLAGTPVDFSVGVSGTPPFFYQWYFEGEPLLDATNATLTIPSALGANAGAYQVAVSNELASVLSTTAVLTVTYPTAKVVLPSFTAPSGRTVTVPVYLVANGNENALQFSVGYSTSRLALVSIEPGEAVGSASFLPNTNAVGIGRIGVALSLPSSQTFAFGTQEVARLVFNATPQMNTTTTTLNFYDTPIGRQLVDTQARVLPVNYVAGSLTLLPVEYEADVAPRGATDRRVMANDWVQVGRFVAALDTPAAGEEFQRADCAPRSEGGNGILSATDWVQAGRYTAGLDPLAVISGPTDFATAPGLVRTVQLPEDNNSGSCTVSVAEASVVVGQINRFQVTLTASGAESALTFTLRFDPAQLSFVYALAAQGTLQPMLNLNTNQLAAGKLGVAVMLPAGQSYAAGEQQVVNLEFQVASTVRDPIALDFDSTLIAREVSDAQAESMTTTWQGKTLPVVLPAPALAPSETPGTMMFRWPAALGNVLLEATDDLSAPDWRPVKQNPAEVNGQNEVAIPTDGAKKFYRLRSQ